MKWAKNKEVLTIAEETGFQKPTFLAGLKRSIKANPGVPMTELAKKDQLV